MIIAIAIIIALTFPVIFLILLRRYDLMETGKPWKNFVTLIFGIVAYYAAAQINPAMVNAGWVTWDQVIRITAPIIEEILKSLIIIYLVARADSNYVVDGAIYAFGAGIGFAMIENIEYVTGNPEIALIVALARVFSTNLVHATGTGLIGTALAYRRGDAVTWRGWAFVINGYFMAIFFHAVFNSLVTDGIAIAFAIGYGVLGVALIAYLIRRGLNIQKDWVTETLGEADRVTQEETKVIRNIETVDKALKPIEQRFGYEKTQLVRTLIFKQAEIGIKKKLLETDSNANRKVEVQKIIDTLLLEMDDLRDKIGWNCMLMFRQVYAGQAMQVFNLLNARIAAAGLGQKGGGLWNTISERMSQQSTSQSEEKQ